MYLPNKDERGTDDEPDRRNQGVVMAEKTTYTEEEIRNVVETIYDVASMADHCLWRDEDVSEAVVASLREGLDYDQMWARYGNWNPQRTSHANLLKRRIDS